MSSEDASEGSGEWSSGVEGPSSAAAGKPSPPLPLLLPSAAPLQPPPEQLQGSCMR